MKVYNLTDHPSKTSQSIRLRGGEIKPGQVIETEWDEKLTTMKDILALGSPPKWYSDWKALEPKAVSLSALEERFKDPELKEAPPIPPKEVAAKKK